MSRKVKVPEPNDLWATIIKQEEDKRGKKEREREREEKMSSDSDRKRKRGDEGASEGEGSGDRPTKLARREEERTSSERELALHASDEDIFSINSLLPTGRGNIYA